MKLLLTLSLAAFLAGPAFAQSPSPLPSPSPSVGPPEIGPAIDQHLLKRNRQFDLIPVIESHPELLGIGLDEDTAIVVRGDRFEVMGTGYVAIYDHTRRIDSGGQFYLLASGDRYNLKTREAERPQPRGVPMERVVKEPWTKRGLRLPGDNPCRGRS
jgi:hypothetical protein